MAFAVRVATVTTLFAAAVLGLCPLFIDGASCVWKPPKAREVHHAAVQRAPFGSFNTSGNWSYLVPRRPSDVQVSFLIYRNGSSPTEYHVGGKAKNLIGILDSNVTIVCDDLPKKYRKEADILIEELVRNKKNSTVIHIRWNVGDCAAKTSSRDFCYQQAAGDSRLVARVTARFLRVLINIHDWDHNLDYVHFIGFGIGAHVGAFLAEELTSTELCLGRLTALDPARLLFEDTGLSRLSRDSALFVDVVHTSNCMGLGKPAGHIDFYVNGGEMQPGCMDSMCSHVRVLSYYSSSIVKCHMVAYDSPDSNLRRSAVIFGDRGYQSNVTGVFYLETKSRFPYCDIESSGSTRLEGTVSFIVIFVAVYILLFGCE